MYTQISMVDDLCRSSVNIVRTNSENSMFNLQGKFHYIHALQPFNIFNKYIRNMNAHIVQKCILYIYNIMSKNTCQQRNISICHNSVHTEQSNYFGGQPIVFKSDLYIFLCISNFIFMWLNKGKYLKQYLLV